MNSEARLPSQEVLNSILRYDPETGLLFWRPRAPEHFLDGKYSAARKAAAFNSMYAGKQAFTNIDSSGYRTSYLLGVSAKAHRVIWKMVTGDEPAEIDHHDHDRANNRWGNLREADRSANQKNTTLRRTNTSGCMGVQWCSQRRKWKAFIRSGGKRVYLGAFTDVDAAIAARRLAEKASGYSQNHGRIS